jgi:hypothetical protein
MGIEVQMHGNGGSAEHRSAKRYRLLGQVTARPLETDITMPGRVIDVSASGCLLMVPCLAKFAVDTFVDISVTTPAATFRALGSIRHCVPNHWRIGVSFVNLSRRGQAELGQLIEALEEAQQQGRTGSHEVTVLRLTERHALKRFSPLN